MVSIKNKKEIEKMREACRIANLAQKAVEAAIRPGISTLELDKIAEDTMRKLGAIPAEKGCLLVRLRRARIKLGGRKGPRYLPIYASNALSTSSLRRLGNVRPAALAACANGASAEKHGFATASKMMACAPSQIRSMQPQSRMPRAR